MTIRPMKRRGHRFWNVTGQASARPAGRVDARRRGCWIVHLRSGERPANRAAFFATEDHQSMTPGDSVPNCRASFSAHPGPVLPELHGVGHFGRPLSRERQFSDGGRPNSHYICELVRKNRTYPLTGLKPSCFFKKHQLRKLEDRRHDRPHCRACIAHLNQGRVFDDTSSCRT